MKPILVPILLLFGINFATGQCDSGTIHGNESTNAVCIETIDNVRYIYSNNLADHTTGTFPNSGNPHSISAQDFSFTMCVQPEIESSVTDLVQSTGNCPFLEFGVATNGVKLDPIANEYFSNPNNGQLNTNWRLEAVGSNLGLDASNAHVQPQGAYHYHGVPTGHINNLSIDGSSHSAMVGWAADGYPIYYKYVYEDPNDAQSNVVAVSSCFQLKTGNRPGNGITAPDGAYDGTYNEDYEYVTSAGCMLDACGGRQGITPDFPNGTYYYVLTDNWPYIPRCFVARPDNSFFIGPPSCNVSNTNLCASLTGIDNSLWELDNVILYPIPSKNTLQLKISDNSLSTIKTIRIIDAQGRKARLASHENGTIDISDLPSGNYFLNLIWENQEVTKKFIKQGDMSP